MQNIIPDERYSVADEAILGAFFKLLKEKKPDRITVSNAVGNRKLSNSEVETAIQVAMQNVAAGVFYIL